MELMSQIKTRSEWPSNSIYLHVTSAVILVDVKQISSFKCLFVIGKSVMPISINQFTV